MSRVRKSGWNPCEEFKNGKGKKSFGADAVSAGTEQWLGEFGPTTETENSISKPEKQKTLTQATRFEVPRVKGNFKSMLPKLTTVEVRRFRMPHYDTVILELDEEGLHEAADYVRKFFDLDETMRNKAGPGSVVWRKPRLKNHKIFLERLKDGLRSAEIAKKTGNLPSQAAALLDTAIFFESQSWEWFWIAHKLYSSCLKIAENIEEDEGQIFNVVKYLYGRFLYEKINDPKEALNYLNQVRMDSEGKSWNASKILGLKQETLYRESCNLLYQSLLNLSRQSRKEDPKFAVKAAMHALERATDSGHDNAIAAAFYELGKSQLSAGDVKNALRSLSKFLAIAKRIPDPESICNAHMELAFAYKELEDSEGTVKHLGMFRQCAMQYNLYYKLAQAHYYTGEYLLNKSQANLATPHLELALDKFRRLKKIVEADRARCAAGISKGQEVMNFYIDLISNCQTGDTEAIAKLCNWKNNRYPFWTLTMKKIDDSENSSNYEETSEIIQTSSVNSPLSLSSLTNKSSSNSELHEMMSILRQEKVQNSIQSKQD